MSCKWLQLWANLMKTAERHSKECKTSVDIATSACVIKWPYDSVILLMKIAELGAQGP
jgi:hypothetical protein